MKFKMKPFWWPVRFVWHTLYANIIPKTAIDKPNYCLVFVYLICLKAECIKITTHNTICTVTFDSTIHWSVLNYRSVLLEDWRALSNTDVSEHLKVKADSFFQASILSK